MVSKRAAKLWSLDVVESMPTKVIGVKRPVDVNFAPRLDAEIAEVHPWEHNRV